MIGGTQIGSFTKFLDTLQSTNLATAINPSYSRDTFERIINGQKMSIPVKAKARKRFGLA